MQGSASDISGANEGQPTARPLRILFITRKWPPAVGGMETYAAELSAGLKAAGHEVEVIALAGQTSGAAPGALAILTFGLRTALRLLARGGNWDVVHAGDLSVWPLVRLAAMRAETPPVLSLSAHGTDVSFAQNASLAGRLYRAYIRLATRLLDRSRTCVAANSQATADRVRALGFTGVATIPLGCRVPPPSFGSDTPGELLFAGRLVARKGLSWFVAEVLPRLPEPFHVAVCGAKWDATETKALSAPRVRFEGPLPQQELWKRMAGALAVILPNTRSGTHQFEGFGLVAAEAAAAGGLVLAARLDGFETSVLHETTGTLLPPGDAVAWSDAILALGAMPQDQRLQMRRTAADAARRHFSWDRVVSETAGLWAEYLE